ncbi:RNA ligase (ATP) [Undibacterium sp. Tian12W]|uniref:RNA ligase (ATP) n=1 Tax=Undibacterium sp. Tian12W TaxID=3413054 RepID=UPI003BF0640F
MRKLVTIRTVSNIRPIPDADAIECASVDGWSVVVKKNEFQVGDACVYFEIDSFLPLSDARFVFLEKNKIIWNEKNGIRLRTIKLRGQISQGMILPLNQFPELIELTDDGNADFSQVLGIEKWEPVIPASLSGEVEGAFPEYIRKTDQERIQNLTEILSTQAQEEFEVTIKLDGSSMTVFHNAGVSGVCGRNWWIRESEVNSLWRVAKQNQMLTALTTYGRNLALQGEIIGEGIQGNPEKMRGQDFYLFDIFDIDASRYLGRAERQEVLAGLRALGAIVHEVPWLENMTLERFGGDVSKVLDYAEGGSLNPATAREGVVFKRLDGSMSFKAISNTYLLKHGDR